MKRFRCLAIVSLACFAICDAQAIEISVPLTLVPATSQANRLLLAARTNGLSDSDTIDLSGSLVTQLDLAVDSQGAQLAGLRFVSSQVAASDLDLDFRVLFFNAASIDGRNLGAEVLTAVPSFSQVTAGTFPTEDHRLLLNQGTLAVFGSQIDDTTINLADEPFELTQVGTGNVALNLVSSSGQQRTYDLTLELPIDATETTDDPVATIDALGQVIATGQFIVTLPLAGDYNEDGTVDAADYTVWRDGPALPADYLVWKQNFGAGGTSGGARLSATPVPEPLCGWLLVVGLGLVDWRTRRLGAVSF